MTQTQLTATISSRSLGIEGITTTRNLSHGFRSRDSLMSAGHGDGYPDQVVLVLDSTDTERGNWVASET